MSFALPPPEDVYDIATMIDFFNLIVAFVIFYQSYKISSYFKNKNYKFFSWSFFVIGVAYLFKILSTVTIFNRIVIHRANSVIVLLRESSKMQLVNFFSLFIYRSLLLFGFLLLFLVVVKTTRKSETLLLIYFAVMSVLISIYFDFLFHATLIVVLTLLTFHFYKNHRKVRNNNSLMVYVAFIFMLIGSVLGMFYEFTPRTHIFGEVFLLIGFLILLLNHVRLKYGKEKNKT